MTEEPLRDVRPLGPGTVFNINGKYRCVLLGTRLFHDWDETYMELHAGPADGITGPEDQTRFTLWLGTQLIVTSRFTGQEVTLVVTSIDVTDRKSATPDDPARALDTSVTVRLHDVLDVQRQRDYVRAQRDLVAIQLARLKEDSK